MSKSGLESKSSANEISIKKFNSINRITGWIIFLIASATYLLTVEPTVSFWDCGEFITSSYKLEVGHPPGAPFFMLVARFFSFFASDATQVALMVNSMSALASSFTILFLFWTITHIARNLIGKKESLENGNLIAIMGSGAVGALSYTFSDTFWFSAVEGEVYAMSSLFTSIVFWAILKWENVADEKYANRWLIFIAYLMGVSIGVHLLNLLAIPAIVFVYYFKKYKPNRNGIILASIVSVTILASIMYIIIPGAVTLASKFELVFVNGFGLPYNSGTLFYLILLFGGLVFGIYYSLKKSKLLMNTILTMITVILIGYSSFALIIIRSDANTPMNQNQPDNVFSLISYLNRDQYGSRPLVYGQYFNAPLIDYIEEEPVYLPEKGRYELVDYKTDYKFDDQYKTIFPRMYSNSSSPNHPDGYMKWAGIKNDKSVPSFGQNLTFFFRYQVGFMYLRYFMWNFAGRQNDIQGDGNIINGNWISGVPFIDNARLGPQENLPSELKNNKGRNKYYFLPLILGLMGIFYMYKKGNEGKQSFWVVMLFFFFTGLAIVIYLNQPPYQPRERDYAYAASFYAFAIWIGFGVLLIYDFVKKIIGTITGSILATGLSLIAVPVIMANENWDDHNRSERYTAIDFASNYLNSCKPNSILFTNGDNDTFPLWYAQEVEGIRTDVRVINLSYLSTYWYVDQHKRQAYYAAPTPFSLTYEQYKPGKRDFLFVQEKTKDAAEIKDVIEFVSSEDSRAKLQTQDGAFENYIPVTKVYANIDSGLAIKKGLVELKDANLITPRIEWNIAGKYIYKNQLMVLDLIASNNWERPVYFAVTVGGDGYYNLQDYFQLEGMAYRLVPIKTKTQTFELGHINSDILYDNMMNKFKWGGIDNPKVYLDENNQRMLSNVKNTFTRLALKLLEEGKKDSAIKVLDKCNALMPAKQIPYNYFNIFMADAYFKTGETEKANNMLKILANSTLENINYYITLPSKYVGKDDDERDRNLAIAQEILKVLEMNKQDALLNELNGKFQQVMSKR
jgi:tetratricopeptide (TPR) repeat protein